MRGEPPHILSSSHYDQKITTITLQLRPYYIKGAKIWKMIKTQKVTKSQKHENQQNAKNSKSEKVIKWKTQKSDNSWNGVKKGGYVT